MSMLYGFTFLSHHVGSLLGHGLEAGFMIIMVLMILCGGLLPVESN